MSLREAAYAVGNRLLPRFPRGAPLVLAFRRVPDGAQLDACLAELRRLGRPVVPLQAVAAWALGEGDLPQGAAALTFDGACRSQLCHAVPVLRRAGLPATFFAVAGALEAAAGPLPPGEGGDDGPLGVEELAGLAAQGFEVGCQSVTHRYLRYLRPEDLRREVEEGKALLEGATGRAVTAFSYPFGSFDPGVVERVAAAGFTAGVAGGPRPVRRGDDPLLLPRVELPEGLAGRHQVAAYVRGTVIPFKRLVRLLPPSVRP